MWLPVHRTWRLNERHYGGLTGLNKSETAAKHGEAQVKIWRRSFDIPPPTMDPDHDFYTIISKVRDTHSHTLTIINTILPDIWHQTTTEYKSFFRLAHSHWEEPIVEVLTDLNVDDWVFPCASMFLRATVKHVSKYQHVFSPVHWCTGPLTGDMIRVWAVWLHRCQGLRHGNPVFCQRGSTRDYYGLCVLLRRVL